MSFDLPPPPPAVEQVDEEGEPFSLPFDISGAVFTDVTRSTGNEVFEPIVTIPDTTTVEVAGIVNISRGNFLARSRLTALAPVEPTGEQVDFDFDLLEAAWDGFIGEQIDIRIGKTFLGWDPGFATQPNGFFQAEPNFADLTDFERRLEGVLLASVTYSADLFDVSVVVGEVPTDTRLEDQGDVQVAVRVVKDFDDTTLAAIARTTDEDELGFGFTGTTGIGDSIIAQASVFGDRNGLRAAVGGSWQHSSGVGVSVEFTHDQLNPDTVPFIADTQPRNFADVRISRIGDRFGWSAGVRKTLDDDSALLTAAIDTDVLGFATLRLEGGLFVGSDQSSFGRFPVDSFIGLSMLRSF
ncbi:MAG: hypothetical protein AAGJ50_03840 [Pseudomonadota bacterium]